MSGPDASIANDSAPGGSPAFTDVHVAPKSFDLRTPPPIEARKTAPLGCAAMFAQIPGCVGPTLRQPDGLAPILCPLRLRGSAPRSDGENAGCAVPTTAAHARTTTITPMYRMQAFSPIPRRGFDFAPRPSVEPSSARPHEVAEHKLRDRLADLLTGLLIEPVMDAAVNAGHGFFFGGLPETIEVPCDAG